MVELIKDGVFHLENIIFKEEVSLDVKLLLIRLFTTCYLFLCCLCKNNEYVQNILYKELSYLKRFTYLDLG